MLNDAKLPALKDVHLRASDLGMLLELLCYVPPQLTNTDELI